MRPKEVAKIIIFSISFLFCHVVHAKVIYYETFGDVNDIALQVSEFTDWRESAYHYSGTAKIGTSSVYNCSLSGSSGKANLYFPSMSHNRFIVSGIDTKAYEAVELSFHVRIDTGKDVLRVYYSVDEGKTWTNVSFSSVPTSSWQLLTAETLLPSAENLSLKIENTTRSSDMILIDDLQLSVEDDDPTSVAAPVFSHPSGTYYEAFELSLSCSSRNTAIYYTLDGSIPDQSSAFYTSPISVSEDMTVSAVAYKGAMCSEIRKEVYHLENLPEIAAIKDLRSLQSGARIKLLLSGAVVTAVCKNGFFVQDAGSGLYIENVSDSYHVGDLLEGYIVGNFALSNGLLELHTSFCGGLSVSGGNAPIDVISEWEEILSNPESYYGCLVKMEKAQFGADRLISSDNGYKVSFMDYFGVVSDDYNWPSLFNVTGILLPDGDIPSLAIRSLQDIRGIALTPLPSVGTVLVCESVKGIYAMNHTLTSNAMGSERVYRTDNRIVLTQRQVDNGSLFWTVDATTGRIRIPDGKYLSIKSTGSDKAALNLYSTSSSLSSLPKWNKMEGGWYMKLSGETNYRCLLYSASKFKLYAKVNEGNTAYAYHAATDVPAYLGYVRSVVPDRLGTVCLPYDVMGDDLGDVEIYSVKGKHVDESGRTVDIVLDGPLSAIVAGVPYLFRSLSSEMVTWIYSGEEGSSPSSCNGLIGTFTGINTGNDGTDASLEGYFVLSDNTFRLCAPGSALGANRAYLNLDDVPELSSSVKGYTLPLQDIETVIYNPIFSTGSSDENIYNMQGIRVGKGSDFHSSSLHLSPGLYLYKGGKYLIP